MHFITQNQLIINQPQPTPTPSQQFMHNIHIKDVLLIDSDHLAMISSHSIHIYRRQQQTITRSVVLQQEIDSVIYLKDHVFFAYSPVQKEILSIVISQQKEEIFSVYKFKENPGRNDYQWSPWLFYFETSQKVVIVRKFYGLSWVIIFKTAPIFEKEWDFCCNESDLSLMDSKTYLVNYSVLNNRHNIKLQVYNTQKKTKSLFKLQNFTSSNTIKAMKLYDLRQEKTVKQTQTWMTILIALNYKSKGSAILLIKCLEQSQNVYQILYNIDHTAIIAQIYDITSENLILACQYRFDQVKNDTSCYLVSYRVSEVGEKIQCLSEIGLPEEIQLSKYAKSQQQLIIFNNNYNLLSPQQHPQQVIHHQSFHIFKTISKAKQYIHLLEHMPTSDNTNFNQSILELLLS